jgi:RNA polymerase sigma-70 factor, ECF subfamily
MTHLQAKAAHAPSHLRQGRTTPAADTSDEALIKLIAQGDGDAMRVLFARHNVKVFRFLLRLVDDEALAEDLVSEVFIDAWRHAGRFEARSQVATWLLAIARYKALSVLRRRTTDAIDDEALELIEDTADDPEVATQRRQTGAILADCLAQLSPAHREIIDLVYYHERTIDDVAEITGVPPNTVKTRMFYARKRMADMLAARGVERTSL